MQSHLVFGHNDRFLFFLTPEKKVCPLVRLGPYKLNFENDICYQTQPQNFVNNSNWVLTVATAPPSAERKDWVQGQQTEISHVPEDRK